MNILKNRTVIGVICIVLSLLICFILSPLLNKEAGKKTEIIRVAKEIKSGEKITKSMIQSVEVGGFNLPENIIKNKEEAVGKYAMYDLAAGDYILDNKISENPKDKDSYLNMLNGEKQAISISVKSLAAGFSGKLQCKDIVSIIAADYRKQGITIIPKELKYVEVAFVTSSSGYDVNKEEDNLDKEKELPSTVTLIVNDKQAALLTELESEGKLHISLVYRGSKENSKKFTDAQQKIIDEIYSEENSKAEDEYITNSEAGENKQDFTDEKSDKNEVLN